MSPKIAEGAGIVKSQHWAIVLGKALFWDQQAGSDGNACANCHYHAGADTRLRNQLNPGFNDVTGANGGDAGFGSLFTQTGSIQPGQMPSGDAAGSNYELKQSDFPLHVLRDETQRDSAIVSTTNDRVGSQGSFNSPFEAVRSSGKKDRCGSADATIFHAGTLAARQVEPRNTPTTINAVFNNRNFWDGRANNLFNGVGVFGMRDIKGDPNKRLVVIDSSGKMALTYLEIEDASLASQALSPILNSVEMSCDGRTFTDVAHKLLWSGNDARVALDTQSVDSSDSVLGPYAKPGDRTGLKNRYTYDTLIQKAFDPRWWSAGGKYRIVDGALKRDRTGYTQMELNMPMFWGVAIMMYESTLVSNQSEFDTLVAQNHIRLPGPFNCISDSTVDPLLARGCAMFFGLQGAPVFNPEINPSPSHGLGCALCHGGADTFSQASVQAGTPFPPFVTGRDVNGNPDMRDLGFANIGVQPVFSDQMLGRTDPYGNPLSYGRQYKNYIAGGADPTNAPQLLDKALLQAVLAGPEAMSQGAGGAFDGTAKLEVDGATKIPTLRNAALTPPYSSWGGFSSLRQILKAYNRGLNRRQVSDSLYDAHGTACVSGDDSGTGPDGNRTHTDLQNPKSSCGTNVTSLIQSLGMSDCDANGGPNQACLDQGRSVSNDDLAALVRFIESLSDPRVQCDAAPFDHPALKITNGHSQRDRNRDGRADDIVFRFPAVGAAGFSHDSGFCIPNAGDLFAPGMQSRSGGEKASIP